MPEVLNNSLFKVQDIQRIDGNQVINRYWYLVNVTPGTLTAAEMASVFETAFSVVLPAMQHTSVQHRFTEVDEVTSIANFISQASTIADGALAGSQLPTFIAAKVRLFRTTKETRSGWKRPACGTESEMVGDFWTGSFVNTIQNYADVVATSLTTTVGNAQPCLVREKIDPVTGKVTVASLWTYNLVSSAVAQSDVSSQNTRKFGRGA